MGSGLRKCFNILIQLGHAPFATLHTGIDLSNMPTEGGRNPMKIGGLNSRSLTWKFPVSLLRGPLSLLSSWGVKLQDENTLRKSFHCAWQIHSHIVFPIKYRKVLLDEVVTKIITVMINDKAMLKKMSNNWNSSNSSIPRQLAAGFFISTCPLHVSPKMVPDPHFFKAITQAWPHYLTLASPSSCLPVTLPRHEISTSVHIK